MITTMYHNSLSDRRIGLCRRTTRAPSLMAIQQNGAGLSGAVLSAGCQKAKNAITAISFHLQPLGRYRNIAPHLLFQYQRFQGGFANFKNRLTL